MNVIEISVRDIVPGDEVLAIYYPHNGMTEHEGGVVVSAKFVTERAIATGMLDYGKDGWIEYMVNRADNPRNTTVIKTVEGSWPVEAGALVNRTNPAGSWSGYAAVAYGGR